MDHHHRWRFAYWSTGGEDKLTLTFDCKCEEMCTRPATPEEREMWAAIDEQGARAHAAWAAFTDEFMDAERERWKYRGYDLMQHAQRWADDHPQDVRYVGVDDNYHSNAALVLVEHRDLTPGREFCVGTSVLYIPQCTGEAPIVFFLYPEARKALQAALSAIAALSKPVERAQAANDRRFVAMRKKAKL